MNIKKAILFLQLILLCSFTGFAQDKSRSEKRVEIEKSSVELPLVEIVHYYGQNSFYRINKETGEVWMLLYGKAYVIGMEPSSNNTVYKGKVNFQLVVGDNSIYLMNIHTGETWYLRDNNAFSYNKMKFALVERKK